MAILFVSTLHPEANPGRLLADGRSARPTAVATDHHEALKCPAARHGDAHVTGQSGTLNYVQFGQKSPHQPESLAEEGRAAEIARLQRQQHVAMAASNRP